MIAERGEEERIWGSMVKQALKRRMPGFNESYYGFGAFSDLLEEARARGFVELERDEKSGGYIVRMTPQGPEASDLCHPRGAVASTQHLDSFAHLERLIGGLHDCDCCALVEIHRDL